MKLICIICPFRTSANFMRFCRQSRLLFLLDFLKNSDDISSADKHQLFLLAKADDCGILKEYYLIGITTEKQQTPPLLLPKIEYLNINIDNTYFFIILFFRFAIKICIHTKPKKIPYPPQRDHHVSHIVVKELLNHALFVVFWFLTKLPQTYPPAIDSSF